MSLICKGEQHEKSHSVDCCSLCIRVALYCNRSPTGYAVMFKMPCNKIGS